ncbi:MAG: dipeptidase [Nitrososphaerales archaeon]
MKFFDTHCDTVLNARDSDFDFVNGADRGHVDLPRLVAADHCVQVFAVFAIRSYHPDADLAGVAHSYIGTIDGWAADSGGRMCFARSADDLRGALAADEPKLAAIIGLEGADPLPTAEALPDFLDLGVRLIIPAWDDNQYSGTVFGECGPLTAEGHKLVELARDMHVMLDVSHLSDAAFDEVYAHMKGRPFIASHSNCRSICPSLRDLTDAQIRALAGSGGVMGINLAPDFLDPDYHAAEAAIMAPMAHADRPTRRKYREAMAAQFAAIPLPSLDRVAQHVLHAVNVGGEDCVGIGGDLDGTGALPAPMTGVESYPLIVDALVAAGLTERQVEKVCWRNMARAFLEVLP